MASDEDSLREAPHYSQLSQAMAWLKAISPADYQRWEAQADSYGFDHDILGEREHDLALVDRWHEHRDDPLPAQLQRLADLSQAMKWLGPSEFTARQAHSLAVTSTEITADQDRLLAHWKQGRDLTTLPERTERYVAVLQAVREERLERAKSRAKAEAPEEFRQWEIRRNFADTLGDEYGDNRDLIRRWLNPDRATVNTKLEASQVGATSARRSSTSTTFMATGTTRTGADPAAGPSYGL